MMFNLLKGIKIKHRNKDCFGKENIIFIGQFKRWNRLKAEMAKAQ